MCTKPNEITRLSSPSGWRRDLEWECECGEKWRRDYMVSRICGNYISNNAMGAPESSYACIWIYGLITVRYETFWHWGRRELIGKATVSPLKPLHVCIINEMWQGMSWVCLHEGENVFVHWLSCAHIWMLAPHWHTWGITYISHIYLCCLLVKFSRWVFWVFLDDDMFLRQPYLQTHMPWSVTTAASTMKNDIHRDL